ncbi:MAG: PAS domain S-box protein [Elusimicrobia bacterium]|nr:PAS domain S-box protein [Elusimicrobiota bacterium]
MVNNPDLYRRVFSSHPHATIVFGLMDGLIEDVNDAALALYGYARSEMLGLPFSALSAEPEAILHKRKDGSVLSIEAHRTTMNIDGREVGVAVIREIPAARDLGGILALILGLAETAIRALPRTDPARPDLEEARRLVLLAAKASAPLKA